jgi:ribonuclease BN (tRNA processing enzyme)
MPIPRKIRGWSIDQLCRAHSLGEGSDRRIEQAFERNRRSGRVSIDLWAIVTAESLAPAASGPQVWRPRAFFPAVVPLRSKSAVFAITAAGILHPGPTVGYRIEDRDARIAYMPDHEPILGGTIATAEWLSGYGLARGVDILLHDGQYTEEEYLLRVGWGHSSIAHAVRLADLARVRGLVLIHHDPDHGDGQIDDLVAAAQKLRRGGIVHGASEEMMLQS